MNIDSSNTPTKPMAYRVDDDNNLEEKDLKRSFLFGDDDKKEAGDPGTEGTAAGGENFGKENLTPSGDDEANPSQYAGYTNAYFRLTEPSEEHPENSNFKNEAQSGEPDYSQAQPSQGGDKEPEKANKDDQKQNTYQEGTVDKDKSDDQNIPGPSELPDQQKVGE